MVTDNVRNATDNLVNGALFIAAFPIAFCRPIPVRVLLRGSHVRASCLSAAENKAGASRPEPAKETPTRGP